MHQKSGNKILETDRLILQEFTPGDAGFILEILNSPGWLQFIGDRNVKTPEAASNYISEKFIASYTKNGFGLYLMSLKNNQAPIGMCGLVKRETLEDVDIGFALLPQFAGKGYAYEAAAATMDYARNILQLSRIVAITNTNNIQSISLLKKIGLRYEKMVKAGTEELMLFGTES